MTPSARCRDCWRTEELDWRVELREVREEISERSLETVEWREWDWEVRD